MSDESTERMAEMVSVFVELVTAKEKHKPQKVLEAQAELEELGVKVRFVRPGGKEVVDAR